MFSPTKGRGVYLRGDNDKGFYKTMSLRKFTPGQPEQVADKYGRTEYQWKTSALEQQKGTSLAIEYQRRTRQPGQSYEPPPAVLAAHAGNWKAPISTIRTGPIRFGAGVPIRPNSRWSPIWVLEAGRTLRFPSTGSTAILPETQNGRCRTMLLVGLVELGPGGVPFDKLPPEALKEIEPYLVKDPVTGKKMFMGCGSDYSGYNDRLGGIDAFRKALVSNARKDKLITLYLDPFRLGDEFSNKTAKEFGNKWNFVDNGKQTRRGNTMNPCYYLPEVQDWLVSTIKRVMKETGADGIRLDEVGNQYGTASLQTTSTFPTKSWASMSGTRRWRKP